MPLRNVRLSTNVVRALQCTRIVPKVHDLHFLDMIEEIMEVFMDDFLVYGVTFDHYLENLD